MAAHQIKLLLWSELVYYEFEEEAAGGNAMSQPGAEMSQPQQALSHQEIYSEVAAERSCACAEKSLGDESAQASSSTPESSVEGTPIAEPVSKSSSSRTASQVHFSPFHFTTCPLEDKGKTPEWRRTRDALDVCCFATGLRCLHSFPDF